MKSGFTHQQLDFAVQSCSHYCHARGTTPATKQLACHAGGVPSLPCTARPHRQRKRHGLGGEPNRFPSGPFAPGAALGGLASMPRVTRLLSALVALAFLAIAAGPATAADAPSDSPWVGLAAGRMGDVLWSVKVSRPDARATQPTARRPCLQVGTKWELNPY